ncbi:glycoside hydrolase family 38 C-terminal domain-containing protein [Listeria costaricensis]|uniref:glycoside hydrolase family 38 N-terminal domain-containing protein n=1 Tax=Listeria costaricensis TaxID=2026604 RepID=UPI000C076FAF|nr:glycoside hydrolase family 38 C-terminal domain-containing protein [Listeria costaricensis]
MKKNVHVIHHTHWDFEWYFTNNESFVQLTYHLDEMIEALENDKIDQYLLDGQMSILDEYFQCFPEQKERFSRLVKAGRLKIGPWYTQTDELIVAGESIVRNLNLGMNLAEELGGTMKIGYLPDSFGQSKDMPKIYRGFEMEQAVFWRGVDSELSTDREFYWEAEDGSKVLTANIRNGYFVGVGLIENDDYESLMAAIEEGATGDELVLPVGGDQRYIDFNLRDRMEQYNRHLSGYQLQESSYEQFFDAIKDQPLATLKGEFISSSVSKIHRSIYSSRYDHKYLNDKIERRMIYQVEPLMVMAEQYQIPYKKGLLDRIWKLLSKNQAHDSAGGCNSDKTNRIIRERFIEADQLSYSLLDYLTRKLTESRAEKTDYDITIFNTFPWTTEKIVHCEISTPFEEVTVMQNGRPVSFEVLNTRKEYSGSIRRAENEQDQDKYFYVHEIALETSIPSLSFATYQIVEAPEKAVSHTESAAAQMIENDFYQVSFENGALHILDKLSNRTYQNVLTFEDSGDEGDTYDYSPAYHDDQYELTLEGAKVDTKRRKLWSEMVLGGTWQVAKDLEERAAKKRSQSIPYQLIITLKKDTNHIACQLELDNRACDHRMRALIDTPHENHFSHTDTPFGTIKRVAEDPHLHNWKALGWREEPTAIFPMLHYVNTHDEDSSWTIFAKGMKEYQLIGENYSRIALTLFRSVGYLGRPDLIRRPGVASGNEFKYIPTPDSQLLEKMKFKFAIQLSSAYEPAKIAQDYFEYAVQNPYYQIQELNRFTTTLKYFVSHPLEQEIAEKEMVELTCDKLVFSSLRKAEQKDGIEIRVYNPSLTNEVDGASIDSKKVVSYQFVNLRGKPMSDCKKADKIELGNFKPGEIKTIYISN